MWLCFEVFFTGGMLSSERAVVLLECVELNVPSPRFCTLSRTHCKRSSRNLAAQIDGLEAVSQSFTTPWEYGVEEQSTALKATPRLCKNASPHCPPSPELPTVLPQTSHHHRTMPPKPPNIVTLIPKLHEHVPH